MSTAFRLLSTGLSQGELITDTVSVFDKKIYGKSRYAYRYTPHDINMTDDFGQSKGEAQKIFPRGELSYSSDYGDTDYSQSHSPLLYGHGSSRDTTGNGYLL